MLKLKSDLNFCGLWEINAHLATATWETTYFTSKIVTWTANSTCQGIQTSAIHPSVFSFFIISQKCIKQEIQQWNEKYNALFKGTLLLTLQRFLLLGSNIITPRTTKMENWKIQ